MIESIVKKIMLTGLNKYAKEFNNTIEKIQIRVSNDEEATVNYDICEQFVIKEKVRFSQIMDVKIDILGYGSLANPFLKDLLVKFSNENEFEIKDVSCFILQHNDVLVLSFYNKSQNVKNISLKKYLNEVGL
jgi:hypothetical protein